MDPFSTFMTVAASFDAAFSASTAANAAVLVRGAILSHGPRTVTGCLLAAWPWADKHQSCYSNVLRRAKFSTLRLARILFGLILELVPEDATVELVVDESLVRRYGPRVVGVGMHRDSVRSSKSRNAVTPGHKWVTVSVLVRLPYVGRALALPLVSAMCSAKKNAKRNRAKRPYRKHRTVGELTVLLVRKVAGWAPNRRFLLVGDGAYGTHDLANALRPNSKSKRLRRVRLLSRFRMDAQLYAPPPAYSGKGRPCVKGEKLPSPREVAAEAKSEWTQVRVKWYGGVRKAVRICSRTGLWYKCGNGAKTVRWVVVRAPEGKRRDEVFFTTDMRLSAVRIVEAYVSRWNLETTFQELRRELGLETLRNWSDRSVRRSAPLLMGLYSLVVVWFAKHVRYPERAKCETPWYKKPHVTFSDMLNAARRELVRDGIFEQYAGETPGFFPVEYYRTFAERHSRETA